MYLQHASVTVSSTPEMARPILRMETSTSGLLSGGIDTAKFHRDLIMLNMVPAAQDDTDVIDYKYCTE